MTVWNPIWVGVFIGLDFFDSMTFAGSVGVRCTVNGRYVKSVRYTIE